MIDGNFNLRYKCNDARDDYHAVLKAKAVAATKGFSISDRFMGEDNVVDNIESRSTYGLEYDITDENAQEMGKISQCKLSQMADIDSIMKSSGWFDKCKGHIIQPYTQFMPQILCSANEWKTLVKEAKQKLLALKNAHLPMSNNQQPLDSEESSEKVHVLNANYFTKTFKAQKEIHNNIIDEIVTKYELNAEQERAFRIVTNHTSCLAPPNQLKMYLSSMGGTSKSQVLKAIAEMFEWKKEAHHFIILTPTGTAAALLNRHTYHSVLSILISKKEDEELQPRISEAKAIHDVCICMQGIQYVFIDEISMVACHKLYAISSHLGQV